MSEKDNTKLKPAEENPWYVLATICDKWDKDDGVLKIGDFILKNDMVWNAWIIYQHAIKKEKIHGNNFEWQSENKQIVDSITERQSRLWHQPLWSDIQNEVMERFKKRLPETEFPDSREPVLLNKIKVRCKLDLQSFIFPKTVFFEHSLFCGGIDLSAATFFSVANFDNVRCSGECQFVNTYFASEAYFINSTFKWAEGAHFKNTIFVRNSFFNGASFFVPSSFSDCEFRMPCDFRDVQFRENYPLLFNTIFREKITLSAKQNTDWEIYWPDPQNCKQNPEEAKYSCEVLREQMETQGLHEQAHFFFRREMQFARKTGSFWQAIPNWFFYVVSDYGHSILLPFVWLYNFCIGGALIYLHCTELTKFKSLGLSVSNLLQITGLQRVYWSDVIECLPWGLKFLGGAQTLLAIPLLFLLLLGLRNRFRLK